MAWAECPTHGPIQDASPVHRGGEVVRLVCVCGLDCDSYLPQGFVEHSELKDLVATHRQPPHEVPDAPALAEAKPEYVGGGWYVLPSGSKIHGKAKAMAAMEA